MQCCLSVCPGLFDKWQQRQGTKAHYCGACYFLRHHICYLRPSSPSTRLPSKSWWLLPQSPLGAFANGELSSGVMTVFSPIMPSRRLTFTVKSSQLPRLPCYLAAHRPPTVYPCLYINSSSPTTVPVATAWTAHSGVPHSTQCTHNRYIQHRAFAQSNTLDMAPHFGQGARRSAHHAASGLPPRNISSANDIPLGRPQGSLTATKREGSRARETQRKRERRDRRSEVKIGRSPSPTLPLRRPGRLADRVTYGNGGGVRGSNTSNGTHVPPPRPQQGRRLQERITRDGAYDGDGGPVQSLPLPDSHPRQAMNTDIAITDDTDVQVDDFADLFGPNPPPPRPPRDPVSTRPIQHGSSHHLPFNLHLHAPRPVQPATRREPIRMVNSWTPHEPDIDGPLPGSGAQPPSLPPAKKPEASGRPVNTYKGKDPIKRRVQNTLLRCILADKPLPKARKKADRMVLKCAGRQEFR